MKWMLFVLLFPVVSFAQDPEFDFPDIEAKFPGGASALMDFIDENRRNPLTPKDEDCKVYVSFVIAPNGHLEDLKVERGCYPVFRQ
ncbi:hypothetical protein OAK35_00920 [Crocinitomicaceae bacterium]|nr:hypothetical protein [Crocinitomicaceae bacterium]